MPLYPSIITLIFTIITGFIVYGKYKNVDFDYTRKVDDGSIAVFIICFVCTIIFGLAHFAG